MPIADEAVVSEASQVVVAAESAKAIVPISPWAPTEPPRKMRKGQTHGPIATYMLEHPEHKLEWANPHK